MRLLPARHVTSTALAAAVLLISAGAASAAPPACETPPTQSVVVGDTLFFDPGAVCSDPDAADVLDYAVTTAPQHGDVMLDSAVFAYTPAAAYTGPDAFAFTATDGTSTTQPVTVAITVEPNQPPQCPATLALEVEPDVPTSFDPYFDCTDDQFVFLFNVVAAPQHGTLSAYDFDTGFTYEPDMGYRGPDVFTIRADDGTSESDLVTVNVTVLQPNHAPQCVTPLSVTVGVGGSIPLDYRTACTDADGDPMSPVLVTGPSHGTLEVNLPTVIYHPVAGYSGPDLVRYQVMDDRGGQSNVAAVNITVGNVLPGAAPPPDTTKPTLGLTRAGKQKLAAVRKKGLRLMLTSDEAGTAILKLSISKATARKLKIKPTASGPVVIGRATKPITVGDNALTVKLSRKARNRLSHAQTVRVVLSVRVLDAVGNVATDTLRITLRR